MRASWTRAVFVGWSLATAAFAVQPKQYRPPDEMTAEDIERSKQMSKTNVPGYSHDVTQKTTPVPWGFIIFTAIVIGAIAPFALRAYRNTAAELGDSSPRASRERAARNDDA